MTIQQLLQCSAAQLSQMTDDELNAHFLPMFKVTRPTDVAIARTAEADAESSKGKSKTIRKSATPSAKKQMNSTLEMFNKMFPDKAIKV